MGMDVYGDNPSNSKGEYFRNNVWFWHPLWDYCLDCHPDPAAKVEEGHSNSGDGLDAEDSLKLGNLLKKDLLSGKVKSYEDKYKKRIESLPLQECSHCQGTGIRNDAYVQGTCNSCDGKGQVKSFDSHYPFSESNVEEFAEFLVNCGGFKIC